MSPIRKIKRQIFAKKNIVGALTIFVLMLLVTFSSMVVLVPEIVVMADDTWYNGDWKDRIPINLSTSSVSTVVGYQVFLNVSYETGMQTDFDDLRFINYSDHTDVWDAWLEYKSDSSYALVWVEVGESITTVNQTMMYMYYNNSGASNSWNGENTFDWFEPYTTNVIASPGYNWDNDTNEIGAIFKEDIGFNAIDGYRLRTKLEITDWDVHASNAPLFGFGLSNSSLDDGYANPGTSGYYMTLYTDTDQGADATHLAFKPTIYNASSQGTSTYANPAFAKSTDYIFDFNMTRTSIGIRFLYPKNGEVVASGATTLSGVATQNDSFQWIFFHMAVILDTFQWDSDSNLSLDFHKDVNHMTINITWSFITHWQLDEPTSYFVASEQEEEASVYSILGLVGTDKNVTWVGAPGATVWSNATSGNGGTMEINLSVNASNSHDYIAAWVGNIDADIVAGNISITFSSDNLTWNTTTTSFAGAGSNVTINSSVWVSSNWCAGSNPFPITDVNTSIFCRFTLDIPSSKGTGTYSTSVWEVFIGHYD